MVHHVMNSEPQQNDNVQSQIQSETQMDAKGLAKHLQQAHGVVAECVEGGNCH